MTSALELHGVTRHFPGPRRGKVVHALNDVSLRVAEGQTLALVGESGSGKSTLGRIAVRLDRPTAGTVLVEGSDITTLSLAALRKLRPRMQMVFQDPWGTLNQRMRVGRLIEEPLILHRTLGADERRRQVIEAATRVRLDPRFLDRFPVQLSGGQLQRVAIARALVTAPRLVILDEPTSSLDLSVRAEILDLLHELRRETGASFVLITHDLGSVRLIADRVVVLYLGRVMEEGPAAEIFASPAHPYTQALFSAQLSTDPRNTARRHVLTGEIPSPVDLPQGCVFASRCPVAIASCRLAPPPLASLGARRVACLRVADGGNKLPEAPK
jgi:oligopeptide/dipeptide ABC transporter ATP-binding protein